MDRLTRADVDLIESATNELWQRCLEAVQHVIDKGRYAELGIPPRAIPLIEESWNDDHPSIYGAGDLDGPVHFAHMESVEDLMTVTYLRDTAEAAGLQTIGLHVSDIGWHVARGFTDVDERPIRTLFKLYPWEWLLRDEFAAHLEPGG